MDLETLKRVARGAEHRDGTWHAKYVLDSMNEPEFKYIYSPPETDFVNECSPKVVLELIQEIETLREFIAMLEHTKPVAADRFVG